MLIEKNQRNKKKKLESEHILRSQNWRTCSIPYYIHIPFDFKDIFTRAGTFIFPKNIKFGQEQLTSLERNAGHLSIYNRILREASRELDFNTGVLSCNLISLADPSHHEFPDEMTLADLKSDISPKTQGLINLVDYIKEIIVNFYSQVNKQ